MHFPSVYTYHFVCLFVKRFLKWMLIMGYIQQWRVTRCSTNMTSQIIVSQYTATNALHVVRIEIHNHLAARRRRSHCSERKRLLVVHYTSRLIYLNGHCYSNFSHAVITYSTYNHTCQVEHVPYTYRTHTVSSKHHVQFPFATVFGKCDDNFDASLCY